MPPGGLREAGGGSLSSGGHLGRRLGYLGVLRAGRGLQLSGRRATSEIRVVTISLSQGHRLSIRTSPREHEVTSGALLTSDRELSTGRHIFSSDVQGYTLGRRCVTALQSYTAKDRIHRLFSSAKKRYCIRRSCMYGAYVRWLTVFLSEKKRKEYLKNAIRHPCPCGAGKRKEKKRKEK